MSLPNETKLRKVYKGHTQESRIIALLRGRGERHIITIRKDNSNTIRVLTFTGQKRILTKF